MVFCSRCNTFWHTDNPHRAGHNVESVDNPIFSHKDDISDSVNLNSDLGQQSLRIK